MMGIDFDFDDDDDDDEDPQYFFTLRIILYEYNETRLFFASPLLPPD